MKEIKLLGGYTAIIDDEDFNRIKSYNWFADLIKNKNITYIYAAVYVQKDYVRTGIYLHRLILNAPKNKWVDHINGNTLDCRKCNLRFCTPRQNVQNQKVIKGKIKYKGVTESGDKFRSRIRDNNGKRLNVGTFDTPEEAAKAYDKKAIELRGEFAVTNFDADGKFNLLLTIN